MEKGIEWGWGMYCVLLYMIYFGDEFGIGLDVSELSWGWMLGALG